MEKVKLLSSDDQEVETSLKAATMSVTIKHVLEDAKGATDKPIRVPCVTGSVLRKAIEYCERYAEHPLPRPGIEECAERFYEIAPWDRDFCDMDQSTLFELISAADYLNIQPLHDLCCKSVANMIKGKTPEQIRETFGIKNDWTPEEEEQVRKENEWCEETRK